MRKLTTEEARARETISLAIKKYTDELEAIASSQDDNDPIIVEGETQTGYYCQMMVDPKPVAKIILEYDYPLYAFFEEDAPQAMWDELAECFGLRSITSFDL